jgi:hypothetical protein
MFRVKFLVMALVMAGAVFAASTTTSAQSIAIVTERNNCVMPDGNRELRVYNCKTGAFRYNVNAGVISVPEGPRGLCFDHGTVRGTRSTAPTNYVKLVACHGGQSQVWYIHANGLVQNAANPDVCLNIEGGNDREQGRVIVWPCGYRNPGSNEKFYFGGKVSLFSLRDDVTRDAYNHMNNGGVVHFTNGVRMVAAGGGNMVAAGAGNMVAAGAGNAVPTGGGNLIGLDGSTVVFKLVGNDGASLRNLGASLISN